MESNLKAVRPVHPAAPYIGGKRMLAERICAIIDDSRHSTYVEPFTGMGGVFLRRSQQPTAEVINDISGDVITLYRVLQEHYAYFIDMLRWRITSRAEFQRLQAIPGDRLTDMQRAARFLYLQRCTFGGKVEARSFGVSRGMPGRFDVTKLEPLLADINERLAGVIIEQLPYAEVISRYDAPDTLFYLDPPYWGCETDYGRDVFDREDFDRLAAQLRMIKGGFLLSINDTPGVRSAFAGFHIEEEDVNYTVATHLTGGATKVTELVIRGGACPPTGASLAMRAPMLL